MKKHPNAANTLLIQLYNNIGYCIDRTYPQKTKDKKSMCEIIPRGTIKHKTPTNSRPAGTDGATCAFYLGRPNVDLTARSSAGRSEPIWEATNNIPADQQSHRDKSLSDRCRAFVVGVEMNTRIAQIVSSVATALSLLILFSSIPSSGQQIAGPPPNDAEQTGQKIDAAMADEVLPYGLMAQDVYYDKQTLNIPGWTRIDDWEGIFANPKSELGGFRNDAKSIGFYGAVYQNSRTGEISIAYRGTDSHADWRTTNIPAVIGYDPAQYHYAVALATAVKTLYRSAPAISVTGHSLGGGEATYAAQQTGGIAKVVTFDSASPPILKRPIRNGTTQINIVVPRDTVGDNFIERGNLPGKRVYVDLPTAYQSNEFTKYQGPPQNRNKPIYNTLTGKRAIGRIIGASIAPIIVLRIS